jgi:hypothetical protein
VVKVGQVGGRAFVTCTGLCPSCNKPVKAKGEDDLLPLRMPTEFVLQAFSMVADHSYSADWIYIYIYASTIQA